MQKEKSSFYSFPAYASECRGRKLTASDAEYVMLFLLLATTTNILKKNRTNLLSPRKLRYLYICYKSKS